MKANQHKKSKVAAKVEKEVKKTRENNRKEEKRYGKRRSPRRLSGQVHPIGDLNSQYVEAQSQIEKAQTGQK
jgi:hypothetical protein